MMGRKKSPASKVTQCILIFFFFTSALKFSSFFEVTSGKTETLNKSLTTGRTIQLSPRLMK